MVWWGVGWGGHGGTQRCTYLFFFSVRRMTHNSHGPRVIEHKAFSSRSEAESEIYKIKIKKTKQKFKNR